MPGLLLAARREPWAWPVLALAVAAGMTWWGRHASRRLRCLQSGQARSLERRLAVPLVLAVLAALGWWLLRAAGMPSGLVGVAAVLAGVLLGVRLAIWLLLLPSRRGLPQAGGFAPTERAAGWLAWALLALQWFGWLGPALGAIDNIAIPIGNVRVSLLDGMRAICVLVLFAVAATYAGGFVERRLLALVDVPVGIRVGIAKVTRVLIFVVFMLIALDSVGVNLTTLTVLGGALGVGLGFGLQRIASNFISGFILLGDRSIRPGDVITIGSRFGVVRELRARYVVVRDRDGVDTLIPNENIITSEVINWSYADREIRLKLPVQVSYDDNPRAAMSLMEAAARVHPRVVAQPAPVARITGFGESGIDLELRFWIQDPEDGVVNVRSDLYLAIWDAFKAADITIPYPHRELHVLRGPRAGPPPPAPGSAGGGR